MKLEQELKRRERDDVDRREKEIAAIAVATQAALAAAE